MLTSAGCLSRRKRLWESVPAPIDWLLVADPRHVHYLSNFGIHPLSFSAGERGLLLLERDGATTLLGDNFAIRSAAAEPFVDRQVVETWYDHQHAVVNRDHALLAALRSVARELDGRPGALESEWLPVGAVEVLPSDQRSAASVGLDLGSILRRLRRQKEVDEVTLLQRCMRAGEAGHARAREVVVAGVSELDVFLEVQSAALKAAGQPGLVYGDFRALNAVNPKAGGLPSTYELCPGDLFLLDYSVVLHGYRSDFTNTICVGEPTPEQMRLQELCLQAVRAGEACLRAGTAAQDVYHAVSEPLQAAGYGALPHHAGHGIGLAHPEPPIFVPNSDDTLLAGDVVTLEPGLYVEGIGGMRFEHNYLVTESGFDRLSNHMLSLSDD